MTPVRHKPSIAFERWRFSIQTATDVNQLMLVVAAYLSAWEVDDVGRVPGGATSAITSTMQLMARAVELSRLDLMPDEGGGDAVLIRELSLTISFAASRMRYLQSLQAQ